MCRSHAERGSPAERIRLGLIVAVVVSSLAFPPHAAAQQAPVFRALADLRNVLDGKYGDEGSDITSRLDDISRAAANADRALLDTALAPGDSDREALRRAWTLDPDDPLTSYLAVSRSAIAGADLTRARETLLRAVQGAIRGVRSRPPSQFPQSATAVNESGAPLYPLAHYADGFALAMRGQIDQAVVRLRNAAATDPLIVDAAARSDGMRKASDSLRRGRLRDALAALEQLVNVSARSSEAHRLLGTAAALAGNAQSGVEHLETALKIRSDDERSWITLAGIHAETGALNEAVRTLERAITAIPGSGGLRWRLAGLLIKVDRSADALEQYVEAERLAPLSGRTAVRQALATLASLQQDVALAVATVDQRSRANLNDAAAHRDLASLYTKQGREDAAFAELAIAAWLDPDDQLTLVALGHSLMANQREEDAVAALERAVALQPDLREARYALAQALIRVSRRDDARKQLAEFERQRADATAREQRALDIAALKSDAAATSAKGQLAQGVEMWRKVIALEPAVAQNYLQLAETLVRAGRLDESLEYFVKTADLDGVAEVHLRLADVLGRLGRVRESGLARETYERLRLEDFRGVLRN